MQSSTMVECYKQICFTQSSSLSPSSSLAPSSLSASSSPSAPSSSSSPSTLSSSSASQVSQSSRLIPLFFSFPASCGFWALQVLVCVHLDGSLSYFCPSTITLLHYLHFISLHEVPDKYIQGGLTGLHLKNIFHSWWSLTKKSISQDDHSRLELWTQAPPRWNIPPSTCIMWVQDFPLDHLLQVANKNNVFFRKWHHVIPFLL